MSANATTCTPAPIDDGNKQHKDVTPVGATPTVLGNGMHGGFEKVGPTRAKEIVAYNQVNRIIRQYKIDLYAGEMGNDRWRTSPEPICISPNQKLLNGQHRLYAVIKSGVTVEFYIMYDVPEELFIIIDNPIPRTVSDLLSISGKLPISRKKDSPQMGSIARYMLSGVVASSSTKRDITEYALNHQASILKVINLLGKNNVGFKPAVAAAFAKAGETYGWQDIQTLAKKYCDQSWKGPNDPLKRLRDQAIAGTNNKKDAATHLYRLAVSAIKAALAGEDRHHIRPTEFDF